MLVFWLRLITFSLLWTSVIVLDSHYKPISILIFSFALGLYFLLTIPKALLMKYSAILGLITLHGCFFSMSQSLTYILILFTILDASFRLNLKKLIIFFVEAGIMWILLAFVHEWSLEAAIVLLLMVFGGFKLNEIHQERLELKEIYDELLSEYKQMKRLHLTAEDNARLEERTRIAREIHDSVGHRLTALIMKLEMLKIQEQHPVYQELKDMAQESLEETRSAVKALQMEESGGIPAVVHLIRKLEAESHLRVQFTLKEGVLTVPLTNEASVVLYRVIQEALTNIMRHGDAREAHITLSKSAADDILFEIKNPLRKRKSFNMGFGLKNMQERVEGINGKLKIYQTDDSFVVSGKLVKGEKQ